MSLLCSFPLRGIPLIGVAWERNKEFFQTLEVSYIHSLIDSLIHLMNNFLRNHCMPSSELNPKDLVESEAHIPLWYL
jgi:hypothetical protein